MCALSIRDGWIHPTINYETPDPECDLDYAPNRTRQIPVKVPLPTGRAADPQSTFPPPAPHIQTGLSGVPSFASNVLRTYSYPHRILSSNQLMVYSVRLSGGSIPGLV